MQSIPLIPLPAFWIAFAAVSLLIGVYLVIFANKLGRGEKIYFPIETLGFWLDELFRGKKGRKTLRMQVEKDQRRNRMMVVSARIVSVGCLIQAIFSIIVALLLFQNG